MSSKKVLLNCFHLIRALINLSHLLEVVLNSSHLQTQGETASEIAAPKPDLDAKAKKRRF